MTARRIATLLAATLVCLTAVAVTDVTVSQAAPQVSNGHVQGTPKRACDLHSVGMSCMAQKLDRGMRPASAVTPSTVVPGYGPLDIKAAYKLPDATTTATVAVVNAYGDSTLESDLALYRSHFGLPECTQANGCLTVVNQYGQASPLPPHDAGWATETSLDVDMVSAACPTCHILVVQANNADEDGNPNLEDAVNTAVALGAKYVSMSWGRPEDLSDVFANGYAFNHPGVAMVAASGDWGFGVNWPASVPGVVAVGGTSLTRDSASPRGFTESVWNNGYYGATSSGCSLVQPRPVWQAIAPISSLCSHRALTDVSVVADPNTGVAVVQGGVWQVMGGTSAGSPLVAAMYALAGTPGTVAPSAYPYLHRSAFADVTTGLTDCNPLNALCVAGAGWDGPTGVGVPQGVSGFAAVAPSTVSVRNPGTVTTYAGSGSWINTAATDSQNLAVRYATSGLPSGVKISSNGVIAGVPTVAATYHVTVTATDQLGAKGSTAFDWIVKLHRIVPTATPVIKGTAAVGYTVKPYWGSFRKDSATGPLLSPVMHYRWYLDGKMTAYNTSSLKIPSTWRGHKLNLRIAADLPYFATYRYSTATVTVR